jgi:hypothetical protein
MKKGDSEPKLVSWGIWSFLSLLNFFSYREMTDFITSLQFFSDAVLCTIIFFYAYFHKKFEVLSREDYEVLFLGFLSIIFWWQFKEAIYANMMVCICYLISFYPTIKEVWKNPNSENPVSWYVCTFAYGITTYAVQLEKSFQIIDFLAPSILFLLHLVIAILAKKKEIFDSPVD